MRDRIVVLISLFLLASVTWGQQQPSREQHARPVPAARHAGS